MSVDQLLEQEEMETQEVIEVVPKDYEPILYDVGSSVCAAILYGAFLIVGCLVGLKLIGGIKP